MAVRSTNRPAISIESDLADGYEALGFVTGMSAGIKTNRYIGSVLEMAHSEMAEQFDDNMDNIARGNRSSYHHVYEWRMIGLPQGRLWSHILRGRDSTREATFGWKASKTPILTPEERKSDPLGTNDPMTEVPDDIIGKLKKRNYVFYWKAPMMEFDLAARVRPKYAKRLFVPTWSDPKRSYRFAMETVQDFSFANPQDGSGGPGTVGRFTAAWLTWWNTVAPLIWEQQVQRVVEQDLGVVGKEVGRTGRAKNKTFGLKVFNAAAKGDATNFAAFEAGRNRAEALVRGKAESYAKASKYIDKNGIYGEDIAYDDNF